MKCFVFMQVDTCGCGCDRRVERHYLTRHRVFPVSRSSRTAARVVRPSRFRCLKRPPADATQPDQERQFKFVFELQEEKTEVSCFSGLFPHLTSPLLCRLDAPWARLGVALHGRCPLPGSGAGPPARQGVLGVPQTPSASDAGSLLAHLALRPLTPG